jgi:hypothetical protein
MWLYRKRCVVEKKIDSFPEIEFYNVIISKTVHRRAKIEIFAKNQNFSKKSIFSPKIDIFPQKSEIIIHTAGGCTCSLLSALVYLFVCEQPTCYSFYQKLIKLGHNGPWPKFRKWFNFGRSRSKVKVRKNSRKSENPYPLPLRDFT